MQNNKKIFAIECPLCNWDDFNCYWMKSWMREWWHTYQQTFVIPCKGYGHYIIVERVAWNKALLELRCHWSFPLDPTNHVVLCLLFRLDGKLPMGTTLTAGTGDTVSIPTVSVLLNQYFVSMRHTTIFSVSIHKCEYRCSYNRRRIQ